MVDVLKLKLSNTRLFFHSTKRKIQVLHKHEITLVFFVLIWFSKFENQIKTKNTCVIYYLWRTCIFRLVEWKNKRVFDSLSFKTPTNVEKCHINEAKYFLNIFYTYQDFRLGGFMFHRAIDWLPTYCFCMFNKILAMYREKCIYHTQYYSICLLS